VSVFLGLTGISLVSEGRAALQCVTGRRTPARPEDKGCSLKR